MPSLPALSLGTKSDMLQDLHELLVSKLPSVNVVEHQEDKDKEDWVNPNLPGLGQNRPL
jgi:hypothetical protein